MLIDDGTSAVKDTIEGVFWVRFVPFLDGAKEILIKRPCLPRW